MALFKKQRGLTYVETMIAATIIAFIILGSINLMSSVYKGIASNQMKTYAMNIVSEQIDLMKQNGFSIGVTLDSCLPAPLSNLENITCSNDDYDTYEKVTIDAQVFNVYKYVQFAAEDANGNIVGVLQSDVGSTNLKQITVTVTYNTNNGLKTTSVSTLVSNRDIAIGGSSVSGNIMVHHASGSDTNPGLGSNATVHFVGYPQYTTGIDTDAGSYTVDNVMPGSYTLYAEGAGFTQTDYASNPLVVPYIKTPIVGVNFSCNAIVGSSVSGNIYTLELLTPTNTLTPTPIIPPTATPTFICGTTKTLMATGLMTGKTQVWSSSTKISVNDTTNLASVSGNNKRLYTKFATYTEANTFICTVRLVARISTSIQGSLLTSFTNNAGTNGTNLGWANTASPGAAWGAPSTVDTTRETFALPGSLSNISIDITDLYTTWDWTKVNNLGACFNTTNMIWIIFTSTAYMDAAWLEVNYTVIPATPTPVNTPTFTPTSNVTNTPTTLPCANGSTVRASDGLSQPCTVNACQYTISNIDPLIGTTDVSAILNLNSRTFYAVLHNVTVSPGTTQTGQDMTLTELSGSPSMQGVILDASHTAIHLSGVDVSLGLTKVATSGGGGAYTIVPILPGTYVLSASAPGYHIVTEYTYTFTSTSGLIPAHDLLMMPSGSVSGKVTDIITGSPIIGKNVEIRTSTNSLKGSAVTDSSGIYLISGIDVGTAYKVVPAVASTEQCLSPSKGYYDPVVIVKGVTTLNKDFKIKQKYKKIKGKVSVDGLDIKNGVTVVVLPSSVTVTPNIYSEDNSDPNYQEYTGRNRSKYPSYALVLERDGTYEIQAPVNSTYNVYAYYSYVSYTGTVKNPVKTLKKYYKKLSSVSVGTTDVLNQNITGALSSWIAY